MADINNLLEIMQQLRDPDKGCPWDLEQDFASIVPHTLEEAYEVADAIERNEIDRLPGELGDLLFQVVFYAQIGREQGAFNFSDVVKCIEQKLIERHPHVFANAKVDDATDQARAWEARKARERANLAQGRPSVLFDVPLGLPALSRAQKLQRRAASVGFDWSERAQVRQKVLEELGEVDEAIADGSEADLAEEIGDLLFACVNWARHLNVDPETCLRAASRKFERRFNYIETHLSEAAIEIEVASLETMDALWDEAKFAERQSPHAAENDAAKKKRAR